MRRKSLRRIRTKHVCIRFGNGNPGEERRGLSPLFRRAPGGAFEGENFSVIGLGVDEILDCSGRRHDLLDGK